MPLELQVPLRKLIGRDVAPETINIAWFRNRGIQPSVLNYSHNSDVLRESLYRELTSTSLPHLLRYEDRNSMAFSIESRVPFLTPQLVNFLFSLPEQYIISPEGVPKSVFRAAMRGIVPNPILDRRDKIGFATPEKNWLAAVDPWVRRTLRSDAAASIPCLDLAAVGREWDAVLHNRKRFDFRVWRWLNLIGWSEQFAVQYS
jgi:asparagine synthase (glutamine-hydrolysing)